MVINSAELLSRFSRSCCSLKLSLTMGTWSSKQWLGNIHLPEVDLLSSAKFFLYIFGGLECVCHFFAYVAYFAFLRDVWIRTQRAVVTSSCATNLATHLPSAKLARNEPLLCREGSPIQKKPPSVYCMPQTKHMYD
jgi:hypothetical protein